MGTFFSKLVWSRNECDEMVLQRSAHHNHEQIQQLGQILLQLVDSNSRNDGHEEHGPDLGTFMNSVRFEKALVFRSAISPQRLHNVLTQHRRDLLQEYHYQWKNENLESSQDVSISLQYDGWTPRGENMECYTLTARYDSSTPMRHTHGEDMQQNNTAAWESLCQAGDVRMILFHLQISNNPSVDLLYEEICNIIDDNRLVFQTLDEQGPQDSRSFHNSRKLQQRFVIQLLAKVLDGDGPSGDDINQRELIEQLFLQMYVRTQNESDARIGSRLGGYDENNKVSAKSPTTPPLSENSEGMIPKVVKLPLPIRTQNNLPRRSTKSKILNENSDSQSVISSTASTRSLKQKEQEALYRQRALMARRNSKIASSLALLRRDVPSTSRSKQSLAPSTRRKTRRSVNDDVNDFIDKLRDEDRKAIRNTLAQSGILRNRKFEPFMDTMPKNRTHGLDSRNVADNNEKGDISSNDEEDNDMQDDEKHEESEFHHQIVRMCKLLRHNTSTKIVAIAMSFLMEMELEERNVQNAFMLCRGFIPLLNLLSHSDDTVRMCSAFMLSKLVKKNRAIQVQVGHDSGLKSLLNAITARHTVSALGERTILDDEELIGSIVLNEGTSPRSSLRGSPRKQQVVDNPFQLTSSVTLYPRHLSRIDYDYQYNLIDLQCLVCEVLAKSCERMPVRRLFFKHDGISSIVHLIHCTIRECPPLRRLASCSSSDSNKKSVQRFMNIEGNKSSGFGQVPPFLTSMLEQVKSIIPLLGHACTVVWKSCRSRYNQIQIGKSLNIDGYRSSNSAWNGVKVIRSLLCISQVFPVLLIPVYGALMYCAQNHSNREEMKQLGIIENILLQFNDFDRIVESLGLVEQELDEQQELDYQDRMRRWNDRQQQQQREQQKSRQQQQQRNRGLSAASLMIESQEEVPQPPDRQPSNVGSLVLQMQIVLMGTLFSISKDGDIRLSIFREYKQPLKLLAEWYQHQSEDLNLVSYCTGALWRISELTENAMAIHKLGLIPTLVRKLITYSELFAPDMNHGNNTTSIRKKWDSDDEDDSDDSATSSSSSSSSSNIENNSTMKNSPTNINAHNINSSTHFSQIGSQKRVFQNILRYATGCLSNCAKIPECRKQMVDSGVVAPLCRLLKSTAIPSLLVNCLKTIGVVAPESEATFEAVFKCDGMKQFWSLLRNDNPEVQAAAALAICNTVDTEAIARKVGSVYIGGLPVLVHILRKETNAQVIGYTCLAIARMCVCEANRAILSEEGAAIEVAKVIQKDAYPPTVKANAALAIAELAKYRNSRRLFFDLGAIPPLAKNLQIYSQHNHAVTRSILNQFNETTMNEADEEQQYKDLAQHTAFALGVLSEEEKVARALRELNTVSYLVKLLSSSNHELQIAAATTISNIRKCYVNDRSKLGKGVPRRERFSSFRQHSVMGPSREDFVDELDLSDTTDSSICLQSDCQGDEPIH